MQLKVIHLYFLSIKQFKNIHLLFPQNIILWSAKPKSKCINSHTVEVQETRKVISVTSFMNWSPNRRNDLPKVTIYLVVYLTLGLGGASFIFNMAHGRMVHFEFIEKNHLSSWLRRRMMVSRRKESSFCILLVSAFQELISVVVSHPTPHILFPDCLKFQQQVRSVKMVSVNVRQQVATKGWKQGDLGNCLWICISVWCGAYRLVARSFLPPTPKCGYLEFFKTSLAGGLRPHIGPMEISC